MSLFCRLPIEIRYQIFRYFALSPLSKPSTSLILPRPLVCDGQVIPVGYFARETVLPLLLTCHFIHDDVAAILYGENRFIFHISGLNIEHLWCLDDRARHRALGLHIFSEKYWPLVRNLWVWTGYAILDKCFFEEHTRSKLNHERERTEMSQAHPKSRAIVCERFISSWMTARDLMVGAWPKERGVTVNTMDVVESQLREDGKHRERHGDLSWSGDARSNWPASVVQAWELVIIEAEDKEYRREFRRCSWESWWESWHT